MIRCQSLHLIMRHQCMHLLSLQQKRKHMRALCSNYCIGWFDSMIRSDRVIRWQSAHLIMRHQCMHLLSLQQKRKHMRALCRSYCSDTRKRLSVSISAKKIDNELKLLAHLFEHHTNSTTNLDFWFILWRWRRAPGHRLGKWRFSLIYWDSSSSACSAACSSNTVCT